MSTNNGQQPGGANPLNPARRPQRLYAKVEIAMRLANKMLDEATIIATWLSDEEMASFRQAIRAIIRADYDANMDTWPRRQAHHYAPDARRAIIQGINDQWDELFQVGPEYDELVEADLLLPSFYTT